MSIKEDSGKPCLSCSTKCTTGFRIHPWRQECVTCKCKYSDHDVIEIENDKYLAEMDIDNKAILENNSQAIMLAKKTSLEWLPLGLSESQISKYLLSLSGDYRPNANGFQTKRQKAIRKQIPPQDRKPSNSIIKAGRQLAPHLFEAEQREATRFQFSRNKRDLGLGFIDVVRNSTGIPCQKCKQEVPYNSFCVRVKPEHKAQSNLADATVSMESSSTPVWHDNCFTCSTCSEILVDYVYCWSNCKPYCVRHYGELIRPRCATCDHLIFSEEYTRAMDQEHHTGHFACKTCDQSLTGQRYILRDDEPHCLACYENKFANTCEQCKLKIGCDSKDLSFKERHWHEKCFKCSTCETSLADRPFATRDENLFCSDCYDEKFAARCDGCQKVFKAGMRKYEYREQQWHEECFVCSECKKPIGAKSFIPRENQVVCVPCYEDKYAQKCTKCGKVIRRGGVTYKGNPWHKECFCCSSCNKELAGLKFTSKDDQPYCAECYGELFAKKCFKCKLPITGFGGCKFISFEERHWHSECFACSKCSSNLVGRGFLTSEDLILCSECGR